MARAVEPHKDAVEVYGHGLAALPAGVSPAIRPWAWYQIALGDESPDGGTGGRKKRTPGTFQAGHVEASSRRHRGRGLPSCFPYGPGGLLRPAPAPGCCASLLRALLRALLRTLLRTLLRSCGRRDPCEGNRGSLAWPSEPPSYMAASHRCHVAGGQPPWADHRSSHGPWAVPRASRPLGHVRC